MGALNDLAAEIREINLANGWNCLTPASFADDHHIPACFSLIHTEVSEATEGFRKGDRENIGRELGDTLIRTLDAMGGLGYDIDRVVASILAKNRTRGWKHGGKRI